MNLALFPPSGGGLRTLAAAGQLSRLLQYYLPAYAAAFDQVYYYSYFNESWQEYGHNAPAANVHLVANQRQEPRTRYAFSLPQRHAQTLASCQTSRVFQAPGILPAWQAKLRWKIPIVMTYGYRYAEFARTEGRRVAYYYTSALEYFALRNADAVIVTTGELAEYVRRFTRQDAVAIIPNGVDLQQFQSAPTPNTASASPVILFVGRFTPQKNLPCLLDAVAQVQAKHTERIRLELVGDGPLRAELAAQAQALGVDLHLRGVVPQEELPRIYQAATLFVLPSHLEGHPKVLLEAMACALPVVVSDAPGNRTMVEHERNGLLFPINDAQTLATRIEALLAAPQQAAALGKQARATISERYDLHKFLAQEVALLQSVRRKR
jgi:glycosyltransferase involved in cell wall biosynthesis